MAELRVERKRPNIWRWIVLLVLIALLVWALVELFGSDDSEVLEASPAGALRAPAVVPLPLQAAAVQHLPLNGGTARPNG